MPSDASTETVRQFVRHETRRSARMEVHPDHADQFRLNYSDADADLAIVDISKGGLGLHSGFFVPRNMRLTLHVASGGEESGTPQFLKIRAVARRCTMVDHAPTYLIGLQFVNPEGQDEKDLITLVSAEMAAVSSSCEGGDARGD